jgi:hypothetical protein
MPTNGANRQTGNREDLQALAAELVERAKSEGVELLGPGGLLTGLTKTVLETALDVELTEHSGSCTARKYTAGGSNCRRGPRKCRSPPKRQPWPSTSNTGSLK